MLRALSFLQNLEESNLYLSIGVVALFIGIRLISLPASLITIGLIFIGIAYLEAQKEAVNGTS
jgi:hypothetical protein